MKIAIVGVDRTCRKADVKRSANDLTENRVFLRVPGPREPGKADEAESVANLVALVPSGAGLYKARRLTPPSDAAAQIVDRLIGPQPQRSRDARYVPVASSLDSRIGSEGDFETPLTSGLSLPTPASPIRWQPSAQCSIRPGRWHCCWFNRAMRRPELS